MNAGSTTSPPASIALALILWLAVASIASALGFVERMRPPMPQVVLFGLTIALLAVCRSYTPWRQFLAAIDVRWLVGLHLTRFVGLWFVVLAHQGSLAPAFGLPAGYGDMLVATIALVLLITVRPDSAARRRLYFGWNLLGLADIMFVVINAARLGLAEPDSMRELLRFPLGLLPTFLVPVIIVSHILLWKRLQR